METAHLINALRYLEENAVQHLQHELLNSIGSSMRVQGEMAMDAYESYIQDISLRLEAIEEDLPERELHRAMVQELAIRGVNYDELEEEEVVY